MQNSNHREGGIRKVDILLRLATSQCAMVVPDVARTRIHVEPVCANLFSAKPGTVITLALHEVATCTVTARVAGLPVTSPRHRGARRCRSRRRSALAHVTTLLTEILLGDVAKTTTSVVGPIVLPALQGFLACVATLCSEILPIGALAIIANHKAILQTVVLDALWSSSAGVVTCSA